MTSPEVIFTICRRTTASPCCILKSLVAHQAGAYPGFCSMQRLGVFLLPPGWDASPLQRCPQHYVRWYPFIHLGGERLRESKVSCPRTQQNVPGQWSKPDRSPRSRAHTNHEATAPPTSVKRGTPIRQLVIKHR